jgi:hypothetical protein
MLNNEVNLLEDEHFISELVTNEITQSNTFTNIVTVNGNSINKAFNNAIDKKICYKMFFCKINLGLGANNLTTTDSESAL